MQIINSQILRIIILCFCLWKLSLNFELSNKWENKYRDTAKICPHTKIWLITISSSVQTVEHTAQLPDRHHNFCSSPTLSVLAKAIGLYFYIIFSIFIRLKTDVQEVFSLYTRRKNNNYYKPKNHFLNSGGGGVSNIYIYIC